MPNNFQITPPKGKRVPILVSVPHCGIAFPVTIRKHYTQALINKADDTDFFVNKLYDFVTDMGITMICAHYNRWVIDLNRSPENQALYNDGRIITGLTPTTDFLGNPIYKSPKFEPTVAEIERRKQAYFMPYYQKVATILASFKQEYGTALLWDAHSIRRIVPTIQKAPFPDLILGNNDGNTADQALIQSTLEGLKTSGLKVSHNTPFKGGNITRHFGIPTQNIHALQLEMVKTLYMDDSETVFHQERATEIRKALKNTFELLIKELSKLKLSE